MVGAGTVREGMHPGAVPTRLLEWLLILLGAALAFWCGPVE